MASARVIVNASPLSNSLAEYSHYHDELTSPNKPQFEPKVEHSPHILIVDDSPENLRVLSEILTDRGYSVRSALSGQSALKDVISNPPQLILIDIIMADMNGYEVCQYLKKNSNTASIPVVFLSSLDETLDRIRAFEVGGVDYISKPYHPEEVLIRVETQLKLKAAQAQLQTLNLHLESQIQLRTAALEQANAKLEHRAYHDALTGLPNRSVFMEKMQQLLQPSIGILPSDQLFAPIKRSNFALLFIDCDGFKILNDSLGHLVGDQFLIAMTQRLRQVLNPDYILIRLGGDEFLILAESIENTDRAIEIAQTVLNIYTEPFHVEEHEIFLNASIGIVLTHPDYQRPEEVLRDADNAMYRAKSAGKGAYCIFKPELHAEAVNRLTLENTLRRAIEKNELMLHYQPIIDLKTRQVSGFEALLRWNHPQLGLLSPDRFIGIAEETGLIVPIGAWVLETAWTQLQAWKIDDRFSNLTMSINVSVKQLYHPKFIQQLDHLIQVQGSCEGIALEITESMMMYDAKMAQKLLTDISDRGIQISIDDFGQGYSSLSYLHELPIHTLKIDRAFVHNEGTRDIYRPEIVNSIITLGHSLNFSLVAEGINTMEQLNQLCDCNCQFGQGYFFSRPLTADIATVLLCSDRAW
jgi:diguanylate cyclase (GGDEF)-like protein